MTSRGPIELKAAVIATEGTLGILGSVQSPAANTARTARVAPNTPVSFALGVDIQIRLKCRPAPPSPYLLPLLVERIGYA